jgi:hypothetical protein
MHRILLLAALAAIVAAVTGAQAQAPATPIKSFAEIAGKWVGASSRGTKTTRG